MSTDPVDEILDAFLDHLEAGAPEPSLDSLDEEDRARAQQLIELIRTGRGIDARRSRPSIDALLAGTEFEDWLDDAEGAADADPFDVVKTEVVSALGLTATPRRDVEALQDNVRSDAVVVFRGARLRLQFRADVAGTQLSALDPQSAGGPVFGRFPETVGLIVVAGDTDLSSVAISPFDVDSYVGAPDGAVHVPAIRRPVLPLRDTLKLYIDEVAPDLSVADGELKRSRVDPLELVRAEVRRAIAAIVAEGKKARTPAKKEVFGDFDSRTEEVTSLVAAIVTGEISPDRLEERIDRLAPFAA